jgi:hypothetical protein
MQPKFLPAHGEREQLRKLAAGSGKSFRLYTPSGNAAKLAVYAHRGFCFSVLICSDLTDIAHRNRLRGDVDALFVLEWNPDVRTFSSIVEATASDLHAFVAQVNNREYGDSRVRAPAKVEHERDVIQVKGGCTDFYVLGKIDYRQLRREQVSRQPRDFKPTPIGFRVSAFRKI